MSLCRGFRTDGLTQKCDGCVADFSVENALGWCQNNAQDEWVWLYMWAIPPFQVSAEQIINDVARAGMGTGSSSDATAASTGEGSESELRGDVFAWSFGRAADIGPS